VGIYGTDIIYGKHTVLEAVRAGIPMIDLYIYKNLKGKENFLREIKHYFADKVPEVKLKTLDRDELSRLSGTSNNGGVAVRIASVKYWSLTDLLKRCRSSSEPMFIIFVDHIEDPGNLGVLLRSAEGAGVHGVIIPRKRSSPLNMTVFKRSSGAAFHIPIVIVPNLTSAVEQAKKEGVWIVGTDSTAKQTYFDIDYSLPIGVIIGSEGKGMHKLIKKKCDFLVRIPMYGKVSALNAASAASIICYEIVRQRSVSNQK